MANLSQKTTDGSPSFKKYVIDNNKLSETEFQIEKGISTPLFIKDKNKLSPSTKLYKEGTKFKITEKKLYEFSEGKMAAVKIGSNSGFFPINKIRKPTGGNGTQYEALIVEATNNFILKCGGFIDIKINGDNKVYKGITAAVQVDGSIKSKGGVKGDPKADIIMCRDISNPLGQGSIYISHKKEGGPEAFQQYGGISEKAGKEIYNHPLTQKFLKEVALAIGDKDQLPYPIMGTFKNDSLANMSIYGPAYGEKFSLQHVQLIGQGSVKFKKASGSSDNLYIMEFGHTSVSGNLSSFTGGYLPVFAATFRAGRGFEYKGKRYNGARIGIYPQKLIATRSGLNTINLK